jgi:ABC-type multidrug transport system fused ATPase/permease subunit
VTRVSLRLQRTEILIAAVVLALIAVLLVPNGLTMASSFAHDGLAACVDKNTNACHEAISAFNDRFGTITRLLNWLNLIPGIIGVLLATPLLLELENGTYRLAWTQSITRTRWLATKLAVAVLLALLSAAALTALVTWWREPLDRLNGRMTPNVFDYEGIVSFGYILFALALALAIGAIWRRTAPALVVGLAGFLAVRILDQNWLRQRLITPITRIIPLHTHAPNLSKAWVIVGVPSDRFGHAISLPPSVIEACTHPLSATSAAINGACLARHGAGYTLVVYQPASRFWELQAIETALFAGIALALIALASWWIHERTS